MSLLREIQAEAVSPNSDVATLLRKCLILAYRLGSEELKQWVSQELNGYEDRSTLPEYRKLQAESRGNFAGLFGRELRNAPIPLSCLPPERREEFRYVYLMEPIQSYAAIIRRSAEDGGGARVWWPTEVVARVGSNIIEDMNCLTAWKAIPINALEALIDTIKTRVLNFTLTIEAEAPTAGEAAPNVPPLPPERVSQAVHTYIFGDVQNLAAGGATVSQTAAMVQTPHSDVFRDLLAAVKEAQAPPSEIQTVATAIEEMETSYGTAQFRDKYFKFMGVLADHIQVFGPLVAPWLPTVSRLLA